MAAAKKTVISRSDILPPNEYAAKRLEMRKAVVALKPGAGEITVEALLVWCRPSMANYKAPRIVEIVERLPRSATGKIAWRELQEQEMKETPKAT